MNKIKIKRILLVFSLSIVVLFIIIGIIQTINEFNGDLFKSTNSVNENKRIEQDSTNTINSQWEKQREDATAKYYDILNLYLNKRLVSYSGDVVYLRKTYNGDIINSEPLSVRKKYPNARISYQSIGINDLTCKDFSEIYPNVLRIDYGIFDDIGKICTEREIFSYSFEKGLHLVCSTQMFWP
jgi:hypothetical protein